MRAIAYRCAPGGGTQNFPCRNSADTRRALVEPLTMDQRTDQTPGRHHASSSVLSGFHRPYDAHVGGSSHGGIQAPHRHRPSRSLRLPPGTHPGVLWTRHRDGGW